MATEMKYFCNKWSHCLGARNDQLNHQRHMRSGQILYSSFEPPVPVTAVYKELIKDGVQRATLPWDHMAQATKGTSVLSFST